jgi:stress response protein SCP2
MKNKNYEVNLFNAFRLVPISMDKQDGVFNLDNELAETIAMNDALIKEFGVSASPKDLVLIAKNSAYKEVYDLFKNHVFADAKMYQRAKAMYTPQEARDIPTAKFRFEQMLHYFSTYGIEALTDDEVLHGWLPSEAGIAEDLNPIEEDVALIDAKVFNVIYEKTKYFEGYRKVASKKNRATDLEIKILSEAVKHLSLDELSYVNIVFKENLLPILDTVLSNVDSTDGTNIIKTLCQNSGDVLKYVKHFLDTHRWSLTTSQKRMFVKALESYSVGNLADNLMLSNKKREHNLVLLNFLDFNTYSRSHEHKTLVSDFRDKKLKSWEGKLKGALSSGNTKKALEIAKQRPGMLVRYMNFLIKNDVLASGILEALKESSEKLSVQTLVENTNKFSRTHIKENLLDNQTALINISKGLLKDTLSKKVTPFKDAKVFIDQGMFDLEHSSIEFNSKSANSDYISSGLAIKIPTENVDTLRAFVYWENAKDGVAGGNKRVDIDLHAFGIDKAGKYTHVGWNSSHREGGIIHSGDITHSHPYGCEFIDIDMNNNDMELVLFSFHSFTNQSFNDIKNLHVGILPVSKAGLKSTKTLYTPKNCIFSHDIENKNQTSMGYGFVNVKDKYLKFIGQPTEFSYGYTKKDYPQDEYISNFSASEYINILLEAQNATIVDAVEDADYVIKLTKPERENEISLIDNNWFAD